MASINVASSAVEANTDVAQQSLNEEAEMHKDKGNAAWKEGDSEEV